MSPAKTRAGTSVATGSASGNGPTGRSPAKRASARPKSAARGPVSSPTDAQVRDALVGLTAREAMPWPHATGLGQMMMWVSAYTRGLLPADGRGDSGPCGLITH